jgi:threonine/homoserine/homoserine lactone efflux protein
VVWLTFAVLGLAALAQAFHGVFLAVKYAGAAYLLYIAYKLWTAPAAAQEVAADAKAEHPAKLFLGGLAVTMGNPKVMVFYLALLPTIIDLTRVTLLGYAELVTATLAVLAVVFAAYIGLASRARRLFTSPRAIRILNRTTGTVMAGAAAAVASR